MTDSKLFLGTDNVFAPAGHSAEGDEFFRNWKYKSIRNQYEIIVFKKNRSPGCFVLSPHWQSGNKEKGNWQIIYYEHSDPELIIKYVKALNKRAFMREYDFHPEPYYFDDNPNFEYFCMDLTEILKGLA
jgi:hypothetical protein